MHGNLTAPIGPTAPPADAATPAGRELTTLLKLVAAADHVVAGLRNVPLPDSARALVDKLGTEASGAWDVLGPKRRMAASDG